MSAQPALSGAAAAASPELALPASLPPARRAGPTRVPWLLLLGAAGLLTVLFAQRFHELYLTWLGDDNYSHGFLVPLVSGFLAWRVLKRYPPGEANVPVGLAWMVVGCLLHLLAVLVWLPPVDFLALVALLYGLAVAVGGRERAARFRFPILFLFFLFPLPAVLTDRAAIALQGIVTTLSAVVLQFFLPVYRQGYVLCLPGEQLEVGEACSGLRQVVAFAALTLLVAHLSKRSWGFKALLLLCSPAVAILANLLRVLLMAFILRHFGAEWIGGAYHTAWGLLTMAVGLGLLLGVGRLLGKLLPAQKSAEQEEESRAADEAEAASSSRPAVIPSKGLGAAIACLGLAVVGQWGLQAHLAAGPLAEPPELQKPLTGFPVSLGAWSGQDVPPAALPTSNYLRSADDGLNRAYFPTDKPAAGPRCDLWMIHFRDGRDRQHHPLICYRVAGWMEDPAGRDRLRVADDRPPVERFCFTRNGQRSYVYYWHYTLEPPPAEGLSPLQGVYQRRTRALPSVTLSVFTTAKTPEDLERAADFVRRVDEQLHVKDERGRSILPPGARMGSDTLPIRYLGAGAGGPTR